MVSPVFVRIPSHAAAPVVSLPLPLSPPGRARGLRQGGPVSEALAYGDLHPRYWFARALWWLWQPVGAPWPSPALQQAVAQAGARLAPHLDAVREAENALEWSLEDQRKLHQDLSDGDALRAAAAEALREAQNSARPRFDEQDPAGKAYQEALAVLQKARQEESSLIVQAEDYDREYTTPEREDLLNRRYGQEGYQGNPVRRWMDAKLAQQTGFEDYARRRQAIYQAIEQMERRTKAAQDKADDLKVAADAAWAAHGHLFLDQEAVEQAEVLQAETDAAIASAPARKQSVDMATVAARRQFTQALGAFHQAAGPTLWRIALLAQRLSQPEGQAGDQQLAAHGDVDRVCFRKADPRSPHDAVRRERVRRASTWFMGQGPEHPFPNGWPTWMAVVYANAEGLPGTSMTQAGMGLPEPPAGG